MRQKSKKPVAKAVLLSALLLPSFQVFALTTSGNGSTESAAREPNPTWAAPPSKAASDQVRTITGVVVDANDGQPLIQATVRVEGDPKNVVVTNIDGEFSIKIKPSKKKPVLVVTYVGYEKAVVAVDDLSNVKIQMKAESNSLDEIVVVGAGLQKKVSVTGAISQIKGDDLKVSASTLTNNLAGKFAGVYANNTSGQPGSGAEFYIRGISNFSNKSATPLILLDDVEISAADLNYIPAENIAS